MRYQKYFFSILLLSLTFSCSDETDSNNAIVLNSSVKELINHTQEFKKEIYSFGNGIHVAVGYGIANSIMVEGIGGNIIIDASDSTFEAEIIYKQFKEINSNPIKAIIYTHNHGDHTFGTSYYYNLFDEKPDVIAHESTDYYVERIIGILNPIISKRSTRMFGTELPDEDVINVGIGPYLGVSQSPVGYIKPNITFKEELKLNIAGIDIELYHAPGETNDQLFVWLPQKKALMPGDNLYKTFPNLYTIRGTTHRDVKGWVESLDHMRSFNPQYLFPSHTKPLSGPQVLETLTIYRDAIQYVHDQTIRLINKGFYPDQIIEMIQLPENLSSSPFINEFYGTVRWSVKSIFNGYLGWFNGNISDLDPLSRFEEAKRFSAMVGGKEALFLELEKAIKNKDMQWALQISDQLIALDYKTKKTNKLRAQAAKSIAGESSNPNKRNYFLSAAYELDPNYKQSSLLPQTEAVLKEISVDMFFDILAVRLNPEKVEPGEFRVCFSFTSGLKRSMTLRNSIAEISTLTSDCDIQVETDDQVFKEMLAGIRNPIFTVTSGKVNTNGNATSFLSFLKKFSDS
ncbi:MAG: alkyl sulfatase dimerization domain-containing protein [Gammaproteobacteria bacterium]|jgi:alkyl sulfatase BDS1-like metallo-beta-lactamase superfamily hydrolase|nr:alkyl sulfatase dimerization domain-containing protein [Gammaproteobacteria bacterium]